MEGISDDQWNDITEAMSFAKELDIDQEIID